MKPILCCLLLCCTLLLTGCGADSAAKEGVMIAEAGYTCRADVTCGDGFSAQMALTVSGGGVFSAQMQTPKDLEGLCFSFDNGQMTVSYGELKAPFSVGKTYGGMAETLDSVFLVLTTAGRRAEKNGDLYSYSGVTNGDSFTATFNEEGFPLTLSVPSAPLQAEFSDWKY